MILEPAPSPTKRAAGMLPPAAGVFAGAVIFDALPAALSTVGPWALVWMAAGFGLMAATSRVAGGSRLGLAAWIASAGVWLHSLLEGVAAGAGIGLQLGGGMVLVMGLLVHLVPESAALFALATEAGWSAKRALVRCAVTWGLVVAGFLAAQITIGDLPSRPMGAAMGLAAGTFTFLAGVLWQQRTRSRHAWLGTLLGFLWVAVIHLY